MSDTSRAHGSTGFPFTAPWITNVEQLDELQIDGPGAVLLNHPRPGYRATPIGEGLHHVLAGRTPSFNVLVGYFTHSLGDSSASRTNLFDPARLVAEELQEVGGDADATAFRLLFGRVGSAFSSLALRSWYWLCRWRHSNRENSDSWRLAALASVRALHQETGDSNLAASVLLDEGGARIPLLAIRHDEVGQAMGLERDGEGAGRFEEWQAEVRRVELGAPRDTLGVLLAYLLQRRGAVKVEGAAEVRLFHPKLYVIERPQDSWVVAGSSNWSQLAFGGNAGENAEISTVHRTHPGAWSSANPETSALGPHLAATAARLFADSRLLASWDDGVELNTARAHAAMLATDDADGTPAASHSATPRRADPRAAYVLRRLVEDTLGLSGKAVELHEPLLESGGWGGRTPSRYQVDAALRLVAMLEGGGERGAFLTDEAGLGKTMVAQLTAASLIAQRLRTRGMRGDESPLYVTIIAPARLVGADAASGWKAAAREIIEAVARVLARVDPSRQHLLRLVRPLELSVQSLSRRPFASDEPGPSERARKEVLDDFTHLALSEIVIIDEAHNFRNGNAASTRTLRMLLSLPVPGEQSWPMGVGTPSSPSKGGTASDGTPDPYRRSVLCLSATPFNNRLEDLVTQIGHFARRSSWRSLERGPVTPLQLGVARADWTGRNVRAVRTDDARIREIVELVLRAGARHLRSGRRLDPDERRAEAKALGKGGRSAPRESDGGPSYVWGPRYEVFEQTFASVSEWLDRYLEGEAEEDQTTLARSRIDGLLVRLVVQRSRARVIRMLAQSNAAEELPERVFRAPWLPRHPLPIDEMADRHQADDAETLEAEVLRDLHAVLAGVGSGSGSARGRLTLFAYELGVRRGHSGRRGGSEEEVIRNAVGFQLALLIKRLQSSPYAFLRTIVRGSLRRALLEMAVVNAAAQRAPKVAELARARSSVGEFERRLRERLARHGVEKTLPALMGGSWSTRELGSLLGADKPGTSIARDLEEIAEMLVSGLSEPAGSRPTWIRLLLEDLDRGEGGSRLWADVGSVLDWVVGPDQMLSGQGGSALLDYLYAGLPGHRGLPMRDLRRRVADGTIDPASTLEWLRHRLIQDRRTRSWLGFVLALHVTGQAGRERAPGGARALVFTDYTDTQDYLTAVATTLGYGVGAKASGGHAAYRRELLERLAEAMLDVSGTLERMAAEVRASPSEDGSRPADFKAPIDAAWLRSWIAGARKENWGPLVRACADTAAQMGAISSHGAFRVHEVAAAETGEEEDEEDVEDPEALPGTTLSDDPVLDAFSPWYQIAPALAVDPAGARDRLKAAIAKPIRVLVATEVLAEGVNLQECGIVVHYDLPWNPTRLIQRNGRVDRRIDARFEDPDQRIVVARQLGFAEADAEELGASYAPPRQVFHLTVPPVEPATTPGDGEQPAERVRRVLGQKLRTIRALFGLTSWPIVLGRDEAVAVLGGQLDFETPGFRRRENLFEAWRALGELGGGSEVDAPPPTLVLTAPETAFDAMATAIAGGHPREWERVTAVAVATWSVQAERGVAVRSVPDWEHRPEPKRTAAISGALLLRDPGELVGWTIQRVQSGDRSRFFFKPAAWTLATPPSTPRAFEFSYRGDGSLRLDPGAPASPTALVEDILVAAVAACGSSSATFTSDLWPGGVVRRVAEPDFVARRLLVEPKTVAGALEPAPPAPPGDLVPRGFNLWLLRGLHD